MKTHARDLIHGGTVELERDGSTLTRRPAAAGASELRTYFGPGWLDVQVNGFAGFDVNSGNLDVRGFQAMAKALHAEGVARFLPTVVTAPAEHMATCLDAVVTARGASTAAAAAMPGVHLEGPFISPEDGARGAHPVDAVRDPDPVLFDDLQARAGGTIRLVTLAPERPGALDLIAYLAKSGVVVAIGHSLAEPTRIHEAVAAGARLSTHLGNGLPSTLPRHPNLLWTQLANDGLAATVIFDGHHLPEDAMRVFLRAKGVQRIILTSDAAALARCRPGVYEGQVGGRVELHASGRLTLLGTPYLAGSASSLADGIRTATATLGVPLPTAVQMVTDTPAALLGLEAPDDLTVFAVDGARIDPLWTVVGGEVVHDAYEGSAG